MAMKRVVFLLLLVAASALVKSSRGGGGGEEKLGKFYGWRRHLSSGPAASSLVLSGDLVRRP
jgi:hypothetical protein